MREKAMQPSKEGRLPWQRVCAPRLDLLPEEVQVLAVGSLGDLASPDVGQRALGVLELLLQRDGLDGQDGCLAVLRVLTQRTSV